MIATGMLAQCPVRFFLTTRGTKVGHKGHKEYLHVQILYNYSKRRYSLCPLCPTFVPLVVKLTAYKNSEVKKRL